MCFYKPRVRIRKESPKAYAHRQETKSAWLLANPPDENGEWGCYLKISELCPKKVNIDTLIQEHVKPRKRHPELKYSIDNIRAACEWCNRLKSGMELEDLAEIYPHLKPLIDEK